MERSDLGKAAILSGVALLMFAIFGSSASLLPRLTIFYAAAGTGIVAITAGVLAGAIQLDN